MPWCEVMGPSWVCMILLILGLVSSGRSQYDIGSSCNGEDGAKGFCAPFQDCPTIYEIVMQILSGTASADAEEKVQRSLCLNRKLVCCPESQEATNTQATTSVSQEQFSLLPKDCGSESIGDRIIGGTDAPLFSNPWIVLLKDSNKRSKLFCGGSLISNRYVLTAAHCFGKDGSVELEYIRIGEHNLAQSPDCEDGICAPVSQDIPPNDIIIHPSYGSPCKHCNDIALIRLSRAVTFVPGVVVPICLPRNPEVDFGFSLRGLNGKLVRAAGWGTVNPDPTRPEIPNALQQVNFPIQDTTICSILKKKFSNSPLPICAGGNGKDTCRGDSGGPLSIKGDRNERHYLVGITSIGPADCGARHTVGLYTNVHHYIPWIQETLKP